MMNSNIIFDFNENSNINGWIVADDIVMGGRSAGNFSLNSDGHGVFEGSISLENNGGFSSVRYRFEKMEVKKYSKIILKIRGDGKRYQFRIKSESTDRHSYVSYFITNGEWQKIEIPLRNMYPSFRGRKLDKKNFDADFIEQVAILIANKKKENFKLLIDSIEFE